jgi:hypothetical protein
MGDAANFPCAIHAARSVGGERSSSGGRMYGRVCVSCRRRDGIELFTG